MRKLTDFPARIPCEEVTMFHKIEIYKLFPTRGSAIVFFMYIALFVNQGLLVTASQEANNSYNYNTIVAVLLTEVIKLFTCVLLYTVRNPICSVFYETKKHIHVLWLYFVPAVLYCAYNNLTYLNLSTFDPTTYFILLQLRVVITGVVFQIIFKKELSRQQWISLVILTLGCMLKQIHFSDENHTKEVGEGDAVDSSLTTSVVLVQKQMNISISLSSLLLFVQVLCSCFAGVYNEHLLKRHGSELNVYTQNIFMYVDSVLCNLTVLISQGNILQVLSYNTVAPFFGYKVMLVVVNNAAIGIVTSFFLRSLNSILKTFASALELVFTAFLSRLLFSIPIYANTMLAICCIVFATVLYSQNPVVNTAHNFTKTTNGKFGNGVAGSTSPA